MVNAFITKNVGVGAVCILTVVATAAVESAAVAVEAESTAA